MSNQPTLFPVEVHFFFDAFVLQYDALGPTVFK